MKNLFKIIYLLPLISLFIACESILQEDPASLATADIHYSTAEGIEDGLKASYTPLRSIYGKQDGFFSNRYWNRYFHQWIWRSS